MKLISARIINIKSYYPEEEIHFEDSINIFVGPNAGGKSNLFEVIQGAIANIVFKHVSVPQNPNWRNQNHVDRSKPFSLNIDSPNSSVIQTNILDKHFLHEQEPGILKLTFLITKEDINLITGVIEESENIRRFLETKVANSQVIIDVIDKLVEGERFDEFVGVEISVDINPSTDPNNATISNLQNQSQEYQEKINRLYSLFQYSNVFYELSLIVPEIKAYPMIRYFGPHRNLGQVNPQYYVDLSSINNYEESFSKGLNQTKESSPSFVEGSFNKLCYLYRSRNYELIKSYRKYLSDYLKINLSIDRVMELANKYAYEITLQKKSRLPMRLSSGEKEFFNLISGLILTGIQNGIVLLDEPELHLHSQWQQVILNLISSLAKEFKIQFFIVTHSPKFINQETLTSLFRVDMKNDYTSHVVKPTNPTGRTELKDLIQFINTTNNEKAFFAHKVILVEGMSDLLVYSKIINLFKSKYSSNKEIEIIEVGSKHNLFRFRKLLDEWEIDNYIIADLDYLKEVRTPSEQIIRNVEVSNRLNSLSGEIDLIIKFSEKKLKEILSKKQSTDSQSLVDLIIQKPNLTKSQFHERIDSLVDYLIRERASVVIDKPKLTKDLKNTLTEITVNEKILLLRDGNLENVFSGLCNKSENKIKNAIDVSNNISIDALPRYMKDFFKLIVSV